MCMALTLVTVQAHAGVSTPAAVEILQWRLSYNASFAACF